MNALLQTHFSHTLGKGLAVRLMECTSSQDVHLQFDAPQAHVGCSFCLEGTMTTCVEETCSTTTITPGISGIWHAPGAVINARIDKGRTRWLDLEIEHDCFLGFIRDNMQDIRPEFLTSLRKTHASPYHRVGLMDADTQAVVNNILSCPFRGSLKRLYLESKGLELLLREICRHTLVQSQHERPCNPSRKKAEQARRLLLEDLANPLSIADLARRVGMSESSLKRAFRSTFGKSIFAYFQTHRLEQAKTMLAHGDMNVTEVAFSIGYSNHSHFSRAFKQQFGISPKKCLLRSHAVSSSTRP